MRKEPLTVPPKTALALLNLARDATPPERSRLAPFLGVARELRGRGFSYEKIAEFLQEHTGLEFTRSQVFAFMQRKAKPCDAIKELGIGDGPESMDPGQLLWEHSRVLAGALGEGIEFEATFSPLPAASDDIGPPKLSGFVNVHGRYYARYRTRQERAGPLLQWWSGKEWESVTHQSVKRADSVIAEQLGRTDGTEP